MEKKRIMKLRSKGRAKRIDFPSDYNELYTRTKSFLPLRDSHNDYQFIDEKTKMEISNQEDFERMIENTKNDPLVKIYINIIGEDEKISELSESKLFFNQSNIILDPENENKKKMIENQKIQEQQQPEKIEPVVQKVEVSKEEEEKMRIELKDLISNKMKDLENSITEGLLNTIKNEITSSTVIIPKSNDIIHRGITCNICGTKNIKGIRYKCIVCNNFNLCSNCEEKKLHDINHILVKIRNPVRQESDISSKIDHSLKYKNEKKNYSVNPLEFKFSKSDITFVKQVQITNTGKEDWKYGYIFKHLDDSQLKSNNFYFDFNVRSNKSVNIEISFEDIYEQLKPSVDEYYVYYQMTNSVGEAFGDVTKFKVVFED